MLGVAGRFIQRLSLFLPFLFFYGCAPTIIEIDREMLMRLKNEPQILAVHYQPASFEVYGQLGAAGAATATGLATELFGLAGGLAAAGVVWGGAISAGKQLIKDYSLEDPSPRVKEGFISAIESRLGFKSTRSIKETLSTEDLGELKEKFGNMIVIDFLTSQWVFSDRGAFSGEYRLSYSARSRLVRLEDSKVLWQGVCQLFRSVPSLEELKADNGALLKEKLNEAADICVSQLVAQLAG